MTGQYITTTLSEHIPIEGADRIVQVQKFGATLIVEKDSTPVGTRGIIIDCLSVLDTPLTHHLNMFRHSNLNEDTNKAGYLEDNARVRALRLRGVKCDGLFLSFKQLAQHPDLDFDTISKIKDGVQGNEICGVKICEQFVRKVKTSNPNGKQGRARENVCPTFKEHIDTDQLQRNLHKFKFGDFVTITEKLHGTSGRFGYLPVIQNTWVDKIRKVFGGKTRTTYDTVVGSRRVTKSIGAESHGDKEHFYDSDVWTQVSYEHFDEKLAKGETVYFEIVGFLPDGGLIMPSSGNKKLKPFMDKAEYKELIDQYGDDTVFTYGCAPKEHKVFVYRITMTNEDGHSVDYSWDNVKTRCEEMGVPHVPELARVHLVDEGHIKPVSEFIGETATDISELPSANFPTHLREGVVVRVERGNQPLILKEKAYNFKVLEGIIKETQDTMEDDA